MKNFLNRIALRFPGRMAVGKFGIWLCRMGRTLQVRYANLNSKFRFKTEIYRNVTYIHLSHRVFGASIVTFAGPDSQCKLQTPLVEELWKIPGISLICFEGYRVRIVKGKVFEWEEILPQVEEVILKHVSK